MNSIHGPEIMLILCFSFLLKNVELFSIAKTRKNENINGKRLYSTGFQNTGGKCHRKSKEIYPLVYNKL